MRYDKINCAELERRMRHTPGNSMAVSKEELSNMLSAIILGVDARERLSNLDPDFEE